VLAWLTISNDVLERAEEPGREPCREALRTAPDYHCAVAGTPLQSAASGSPIERPPSTREVSVAASGSEEAGRTG
jgi:hypothetical protein